MDLVAKMMKLCEHVTLTSMLSEIVVWSTWRWGFVCMTCCKLLQVNWWHRVTVFDYRRAVVSRLSIHVFPRYAMPSTFPGRNEHRAGAEALQQTTRPEHLERNGAAWSYGFVSKMRYKKKTAIYLLDYISISPWVHIYIYIYTFFYAWLSQKNENFMALIVDLLG